MLVSTCAFFLFGPSKNAMEESHPITKTYEVSSFDGVSLAASYDVSVEYGTKQEVTVTAPEHLMDKVVVKVKNNVVVLGLKKGNYQQLDIKAKVVLPKLNYGAVTGSGEMRIAPFSSQRLILMVSGSGDLNTDQLQVSEQLGITISGSGSVRTKGTTAHSAIKITGSGSCQAVQLATQTNHTLITGSGSATVAVQEYVKAQLMGSGSLYYEGTPKIEQSTLGSGKVRVH